MDDGTELLVVQEEVSVEKKESLQKTENAVDPDLVDKGFTCERKPKRFFVDDTNEQNVTKIPPVRANGID